MELSSIVQTHTLLVCSFCICLRAG
jgi:hypothetical protein